MLLQDLFEDARQDISMRNFISDISFRIMHKLYDGVTPDRRFNFEGLVHYTYYPETFGIDRAMPSTLIAFTDKKSSTISGNIMPLRNPVDGKYNRWVVVHCLSGSPETSLRRMGGNLEFQKVLKHELTHAFDDDRTNSAMDKGYKHLEKHGHEPYFNCGPEFNAYYNDIASSLTNLARDIDGARSPDEARQIIDLFGFNGDFRHDFARLMNEASITSKPFLQWITDKNQKKLVRRLYLLHSEIMGRLTVKAA